MTYNVHRCLGSDGVYSPERIAHVIGRYEPDLVALQELDVGRARSGGHDQPAVLAALLKMDYCFHPAFARHDEHYGDALLSRLPMRLVRAGALPTLPHRPHLERRGALWVEVSWNGHTVQVLNTHLGLRPRERLAQVEALLGPEWLGHPSCVAPRILCGDFNAWPATRAYRRLRHVLRDAQDRPAPLTRGTYPSRWPVLRIDHVFLSLWWRVRQVQVPRTRLTRTASDHLPLLVEIDLP